MKEVRIIGVPRSGTNLAKYILETSTNLVGRFNIGWWKHGLIPSFSNQQYCVDTLPTIIMFRDPFRQLASFYNFVSSGNNTFSYKDTIDEFINSPIQIYAAENQTNFGFLTPISYWYAFYYSAIHWRNPNKVFIFLNEVQSNPSIIVSAGEILFNEMIRVADPSIPSQYLSANADFEPINFRKDTTFESEKNRVDLIYNYIINQKKNYLGTDYLIEIFDHMYKIRFKD